MFTSTWASNVHKLKQHKQSGGIMANEIYKGYKIITGTTDEITEQMINPVGWYANQYAVIQNLDDGSEKEMRWDGEKFVTLKFPPSKIIKARNPLQRCALDMLNNPDITICAVLGTYGSGKSMLTMTMAKHAVLDKGRQSKILGIREPVGHGKNVGYLKGDFSDKTDMFFTPLIQQLDGGIYEYESLKDKGVLETNIAFYLKGTTYNSTIILVDESEDLNEEQIRLVGTRVGEDSRIFFNGDYRQAIYNKTHDNPLVRMCDLLKGNPLFGCIYLEDDVRSETSKLFANMFYKE